MLSTAAVAFMLESSFSHYHRTLNKNSDPGHETHDPGTPLRLLASLRCRMKSELQSLSEPWGRCEGRDGVFGDRSLSVLFLEGGGVGNSDWLC